VKKIILICVLAIIIPAVVIPVFRHIIHTGNVLPAEALRPDIQLGLIVQITIDTDGSFDYTHDESATSTALEDFYPVTWDDVRNILSQPANNITPNQYDLLTQIFVTIHDDVGATERFLNYLSTPIEILCGVDVRQVRGKDMYIICQDKVMQMQMRIENTLAFELDTQFEFIRQGTSVRDTIIKAICAQRRILMERSALLTVVSDMAAYTSVVWGRERRQSQRVLVGTGETPGPFFIRESVEYIGIAHVRRRWELVISVNFGTLTKNTRNSTTSARLRMAGGAVAPTI